MGFEEGRIDELQVCENATVVVDLVLLTGQEEDNRDECADEESGAGNVHMQAIHSAKNGRNWSRKSAHGAV